MKEILFLVFVALISVTASAAIASPKDDCQKIMTFLGYPTDDYAFERAGIFTMERHNFGAITCFVTATGEIDSVYRGDTPLAEDGYFGLNVLKHRDEVNDEIDTRIEAARQARDAAVAAARETFWQEQDALRAEREERLATLRETSNPFSNSQANREPEPAQGGATEVLSQEEGGATSDVDGAVLTQEGALVTPRTLYVIADQLTRRTCPSIACGDVGWILYRQQLNIFEVRNGWARITKEYDANCENGQSNYVNSGNGACTQENGIVNGTFSEWVDTTFLSAERPADPADSATEDEELVKDSDDFRIHRKVFAEAAGNLIDQRQCTTMDFRENGGWSKSTTKGTNVYFIYCGGFARNNRIYLDASTGKTYR